MGKKSGLQKKVSSIFDGTPIQNKGGVSGGYSPGKVRAAEPKSPDHKRKEKVKLSQVKNKAGASTGLKEKLFQPEPGVNPKKQKILAGLIPVLMLMMVGLLARNLGMLESADGKTGAASESSLISAERKIADSRELDEWLTVKEIPSDMRDPMSEMGAGSRQSGAGGDIGRMALRGIVYSEESPSIVVGTQIYKVGDSIGEVKVVSIDKNKAVFKKDEQVWEQRPQ